MKYKVGGKVKIKNARLFNPALKAGDIGTISSICGDSVYIDFPEVGEQITHLSHGNIEPATLSTGDMVNIIKPGQEYKRESDGHIVTGVEIPFTGECVLNWAPGRKALSPTDRWTLVPEPPKPVSFMEAHKANCSGKNTACNLEGSIRFFCKYYGGSYLVAEIEDGTWTVEE
jgi:hypothetical protein